MYLPFFVAGLWEPTGETQIEWPIESLGAMREVLQDSVFSYDEENTTEWDRPWGVALSVPTEAIANRIMAIAEQGSDYKAKNKTSYGYIAEKAMFHLPSGYWIEIPTP